MSAMRTPTRQAPPSPVGVVNGREIVDHRLRWRILLTCLLATAITHVQVLAARPRFRMTEMWRTAAVVAMLPLTSLVVACVSPAASPDDISPVIERGMLYTSIVGGVGPISAWVKFAPQHPCHPVGMLPGALMCLVMGAVPLLGMRNAMNYWPAHRFALVASGVLQFARVAAQAYAPRLANAAAALGLSGLLPMPVAEQCQAHGLYLPGDVSLSGALVFGIMWCATGLALTPSMRTRLATLSGRFGLPAARVLRLGDGIVLEPDPVGHLELERNAAEGVGLLASDSAGSAHHRRSQREAQQCRSAQDWTQLEVELPPHPQKRTVRDDLLLDQPLVLGRPVRRDQSCGGTRRRCGREGTSATNSELDGAILHSATEAEGTLQEESRPGMNGSADDCGVQPHLPYVASSKGSFSMGSSIGSSVGSIATEAHIYLRCMNDVSLRYDRPFDLAASTVYTPRPEFSASLADLPRRVSAALSEADRANLLIEVGCDGCLVYASTGEPIVPSSPPYSSLCTRMFVALTSGAIYIPADDRVQFHNELAGNAPVIAAGEMVLSGGRLHSISNRSGHYRPAPESLRLVVSLLRSKGAKTTIPFKELHYDAAGNLEVQAMGATPRSPPAPIAHLDSPPDLDSPPPGVDTPPTIVRVDVREEIARGSGGREEIASVPYWSRPTRPPVRL